jgi:preprotein translocase subunit SecY
MKKFIESISNVWKIEELKNRILITLVLLLVSFWCWYASRYTAQLGNLAGQTKEILGLGLFGVP